MSEVTGVRLLTPVPTGGPVVVLPAVRKPDDEPVRLILVTAGLDQAARVRTRRAFADLEAALSRLDEDVVLPLLDHGVDAHGRPYMLTPRPGPTLDEVTAAEGPRPVEEVVAAVRAAADGLHVLAASGLVTAPPPVFRTGSGSLVLGTPLPPLLDELPGPPDEGDGHEPPEVLRGEEWTPAGQVHACASLAWSLLTGRPAHPAGQNGRLARLMGADPQPMRRTDVPDAVVTVLRSALASDPADRPGTPGLLAEALERACAPAGGRVLGGRYRLDTEIGSGSFGQVWAGRRLADDMPVAVKLLHGRRTADAKAIERFHRERRALQALDHPHLVRVHDFVESGDEIGIVMDLVDEKGETLRHVIDRGALTAPEAATLLTQVAEALAAVHAAGLVHRDVKPENVLIGERDGRRVALLSDFGTVRDIDASGETQLIGTLDYLAPELAADRPPQPAVDVYALGVMGYEVFAGRRPFTAKNRDALMMKHLSEDPAPLVGTPDGVWELVSACLAKPPADRPDAAEAARRWKAVAAACPPLTLPIRPEAVPVPPAEGGAAEQGETTGTVVSPRRAPQRPDPAPPRRSRKLLVAVAAAALLGLPAGAGLAVYDARSESPPAVQLTPTRPAAYLYPLPASAALVRPGLAKLTWTVQPGTLPGARGFVVSRVGQAGQVPVSETLPLDVTSFAVHDLRPGRQTCFMVLAIGVTTPPPAPLPPLTCVTSPDRPGP